MVHCKVLKCLLRIIDMSQAFSTVSVAGQSQPIIARIGELLTQNQFTVACAESCTGGGVAFALTSVAGSSAWFEQSYVTYSNQAKQDLLGVSDEVLSEHGAVSAQCVTAMARGLAQKSGAQLAVSVSGIAGPGGGSDDKPVGTVWFGFCFAGHTETFRQVFRGDRAAVRSQAIGFVLQYLHDWLVETN